MGAMRGALVTITCINTHDKAAKKLDLLITV
jgi:hypothetical protein